MRIDEYISTFRDEAMREAVVDQIMKCRVVRDAMGMPAGKALLNHVVDEVRNKVQSLVDSCTKNSKKDQTEQLQQAAMEIYIMYNLLKGWAEIIVKGEEHEEKMKEQ